MQVRPNDLAAESLPNGDYSVHIEDDVVSWGTLPPSGIESVTGTGIVEVDNTDPANVIVSALVPLTTVIGGVPDLVWDADNQLVFTEAT